MSIVHQTRCIIRHCTVYSVVVTWEYFSWETIINLLEPLGFCYITSNDCMQHAVYIGNFYQYSFDKQTMITKQQMFGYKRKCKTCGCHLCEWCIFQVRLDVSTTCPGDCTSRKVRHFEEGNAQKHPPTTSASACQTALNSGDATESI